MANPIASGNSELAHAVVKALLGPDGCHRVRRLVLEIDASGPVKVYVERFAERESLAGAVEACAALAGNVELVECDSLAVADDGCAPSIVHVPKGG
jgi:hypothetical protein